MAYLEFKDQCYLCFDPHGLEHDSFNGWIMRSVVRVSMNSAKHCLGQFMSGPKLRDGILQFATESLDTYSYEPEFDGDLPSSKMALYLKRGNGRIQIKLRHEYYFGWEDHENWMSEINSKLEECSILGREYCEARIQRLDDLVVVYSWFTVDVPDEAAVAFLEDLTIELDAKAEE